MTPFQRLFIELNGRDPDETQPAFASELLRLGLTPPPPTGPWYATRQEDPGLNLSNHDC
jgi:hypothetical protein